MEEKCLEDQQNLWLSSKISQCGEIIGISVNDSERGWHSFVEFAQERECQNRAAMALNRTKKGARELQNLACTINYKKGQS